MRAFTLIFLLIFHVGCCESSNPDDSLPVYMRGIGWDRVEGYLKEDLRLSGDVIPLSYALELAVNVRGHAGATKSDLNGTVYIVLDIMKPVDKIELHSNGLTIEKAELVEYKIMEMPAGVDRISSNSERETITIHLNRTIHSKEEFMLKISYRGMARMDEYGLYENWDPQFNKKDSKRAFVLASKNFPTGARTWFPCFDEPEKKANFELHINHPSKMNAYSNTEVDRSLNITNGRTLSVFKKTGLMPTYQVALSLNNFPRMNLDVQGFGKVQWMSSNSSHESYAFDAQKWIKELTDIPGFLSHTLEQIGNVSLGKISTNKLDIIILEGSSSNTIQPGLITIGRTNLWSCFRLGTHDLRNLTQLRIGNILPVRFSNQIWLNDMFSYILYNKSSIYTTTEILTDQLLYSSLHERPLRDQMIHSSSTKQYLSSRNPLPSLKASHVLKMILRFCPLSEKAIQKYIIEHAGEFADIDDFIVTVANSCDDIETVMAFLEDFINQCYSPEKALLLVKRSKDNVTIEQTRYHSTYFDSDFRDNKTSYSIPIFFTIDGQSDVKVFRKNETSLTISVPETSLFVIDHKYEHLYFVIYDDDIVPQRNITEEERLRVVPALQKSTVVALNIGYVKHKGMVETLKHFVQRRIFNEADMYKVTRDARYFIWIRDKTDSYDEEMFKYHLKYCKHRPSWNGWFGNDTEYWNYLANDYHFIREMHCMTEWSNTTSYSRFLEDNFMGENTIIRANLLQVLAQRDISSQWRELHRFFFKNAANFNNHRFDLLADTVLNQATSLLDYYPYEGIHVDYLDELRQFVIHNPRKAASMSTEIQMRLELEFIRDKRPRFIFEDGDIRLHGRFFYEKWIEEE